MNAAGRTVDDRIAVEVGAGPSRRYAAHVPDLSLVEQWRPISGPAPTALAGIPARRRAR